MFRGDIWDVQFPQPIGARPCVILTVNTLIPRLGAITVAEITGTEGPSTTHIELGADAGLTGRDRSYLNATALHTIPKGKLRRQRGRLAPPELQHLARAIRLYLDVDVI